MITEIDASEIICTIISLSNHNNTNDIKVPYNLIRHVSHKIENNFSTLRVDCDLISIDAFRCYLPNNVKMLNDYVLISNLSNIKPYIERLVLSDNILNLIKNKL